MPREKRSYAQALAGDAAASSQQLGKRVRPSPVQYRFPWSFVVDGSQQHPEEAVAAMLSLENHVCQHGDIALFVVCDASVKRKSRFAHGGYGLVFKRLSPGSPDHGAMVEQAWAVIPAIDSNLLEAIALLQSLWQANKEIRAAIQEQRLFGPGGPSGLAGSLSTRGQAIKVTIATDSQSTLERLQKESLRRVVPSDTHRPPPPVAFTQSNPSGTRAAPSQIDPPQASGQADQFTFVPPGHIPAMSFPPVPQMTTGRLQKLLDEVIQHCVQEAQALYNLPGGFRVDLTFRWVPAHVFDSGMMFHPMANTLAGDARKTRKHLHTVNFVAVPFAPSAVRLMKDFPIRAESSPDTPSDEEVIMCHSADCAARTAADEERHQVTLRQIDLVREDLSAKEKELDAVLKQTEASRAKLEAAEKALEDWTEEWDRIALEKVEEAKTLCENAGTALGQVAEQRDGLRAAVQLLQEDRDHNEYRAAIQLLELQNCRDENSATQQRLLKLQDGRDEARLQRERDANRLDRATTQISQLQQELDHARLQRVLDQDRAAVRLFSAVVGAAGLTQRLFG